VHSERAAPPAVKGGGAPHNRLTVYHIFFFRTHCALLVIGSIVRLVVMLLAFVTGVALLNDEEIMSLIEAYSLYFDAFFLSSPF
jgi:hypothetical protein